MLTQNRPYKGILLIFLQKISRLSRALSMEIMNFQGPILYSSTFRALIFAKKCKYFEGLSRISGNAAE